MRFAHKVVIGASALLGLTFAASAHPSGGGVVDFRAGAHHPFTGLDHTLAMIAVGLIASRALGRERWLLPLLFLAGMSLGGGAAVVGEALPMGLVEHLIAASVVVFGLLLVAVGKLPDNVALWAVPAFAFFHGYAHLVEGVAEDGRSATGYAAGMAIASMVLLGAGLSAGLILRKWPVQAMWRVAGGAVAVIGLALLVRTF